jgi:hypothetical protein
MNARLNALATVLDVVVLVGLGLGLFFAPLTLVWAFDDGFATDLLLSWAIAVDGWMLGHGVPLTFTLDPLLAQSLSLGETNSSFVVDVALLGVGLLTLLWGYRIGRRSGTRIYPVSTWFLAVGTLVALSFAMVFFPPCTTWFLWSWSTLSCAPRYSSQPASLSLPGWDQAPLVAEC